MRALAGGRDAAGAGRRARRRRRWHHDGVDADELYGLPLERFTPERNALARELRNRGRREEAAEVAALRKPSVAAWAVNQLVRTQRRAVAELFEAGDALRAAHEEVLAGRGEAGSLREAVEREREAVQALSDAARGLLTSQGHELSATTIDRVTDTLHAGALEVQARRQVQEGRLERELRHVGLGTIASVGAPPQGRAARKPAARKPDRRKAGKADTGAAERLAAEREREQRLAEERAAARATEREARRRLERAERSAKLAAERRDRAAHALDDAESELGEAESELREAREELDAAEQAVRQLGR